MTESNAVDRIVAFLLNTITEIAQTEGGWKGIAIDKDVPLFGDESALDSRSLVELLISLEEFMEEELGAKFDWTSDRAMSTSNSPFRTVTTLAEFAATDADL